MTTQQFCYRYLGRDVLRKDDAMDSSTAMTWVDRYIAAWRRSDAADLGDLFTEDVAYRTSPYEEPMVGYDALAEFWVGDADADFAVTAEPVAAEGDRAVVRLEVDYRGDKPQQYRDLWVLRFADDGRVADFEEWAYWPGKPFTAAGEA